MSEHGTFTEKNERKVNMISLVLGILGFLVLWLQQYGNGVATKTRQEESQIQMEKNQAETKSALEANQKETKASIDGVANQVSSLKETTLTQGFTLAVIQKEQGNLAGQISANSTDDVRQWENLRSVEALAKAALSREQFADWRREYERRNPGSVAPAVP